MTQKNLTSEFSEGQRPLNIPFDIEALYSVNQKFYRAMISCNEELMAFGRNRLRAELDMPQKLAECKSPQELAEVCLGFYQTAFRQYTEEASQLSRICSGVTGAAADTAKQSGD